MKIKFRAWDNDLQSFSMNTDIRLCTEFNKDLVYMVSGIAMSGIIFQLFTGLTDKNGKEIYEGDIIELHNWGIRDKSIIGKAIVVWDKEHSKFDFKMLNGFYIEDEYDRFRTTPEIIGNIFENKELLNGT